MRSPSSDHENGQDKIGFNEAALTESEIVRYVGDELWHCEDHVLRVALLPQHTVHLDLGRY